MHVDALHKDKFRGTETHAEFLQLRPQSMSISNPNIFGERSGLLQEVKEKLNISEVTSFHVFILGMHCICTLKPCQGLHVHSRESAATCKARWQTTWKAFFAKQPAGGKAPNKRTTKSNLKRLWLWCRKHQCSALKTSGKLWNSKIPCLSVLGIKYGTCACLFLTFHKGTAAPWWSPYGA